MRAIPPRKLDVLKALRDIQLETGGFAPTVREIGARLGMHAPSTVQNHVNWLVAHGLVERRGSRRVISSLGHSVLNGGRLAA